MKQEPYVIERTYNAPVKKVWQAITDKDQMQQWYFDIKAFELSPGFEFSFECTDDGKTFVHLCQIIEVIPLQKLKYSWRYQGYEGNSFVTFELFPEKEGTRLRLTHEGLDSFPPLSFFAESNFNMGWTEIIGKLLPDFLEKQS